MDYIIRGDGVQMNVQTRTKAISLRRRRKAQPIVRGDGSQLDKTRILLLAALGGTEPDVQAHRRCSLWLAKHVTVIDETEHVSVRNERDSDAQVARRKQKVPTT